MADHNGKIIIQHTVLISMSGNKRPRKEILLAVVESTYKLKILATDTKQWLAFAFLLSTNMTKKETLTVGSTLAVAIREMIQSTTKTLELEPKQFSIKSNSKLDLTIDPSRKSQQCHKLMMMKMKVPTIRIPSLQTTNPHQKRPMPREKSDRREKNGLTKLTTWQKTLRVCTCSISSLCSSLVCHFSLPSFVYALLFIMLSKSEKHQPVMKELS